MKNILIIPPFNPYPLISGGHQAIFNGIAILKDVANVYVYVETTESSSGAQIATRQMVKHSTVSSAYAFKYEVLAKLLDIDFERRIDDSGKEVADNPFT